MKLYEIDGKKPVIDKDVAYIAESAILIGDVTIGRGCTIFDNVVLEGVKCKITIGDYTNIQSGTVVHGMYNEHTQIGKYVTIGHRSLIHGGIIGDYVSIGIGSIIMGYSKIGDGSEVGAGSLITMHKEFAPKSQIIGHPAKLTKELTDTNIEEAKRVALLYYEEGQLLASNLRQIKS
jgi:carbonic anhydrase/acetyltransferase-like protein (isoleucine patch superfamily)